MPSIKTCLEPYSSLFHPGWREYGAQLMRRQAVLLMHDIYYDFACQLSEYCLNREPELFKNTRFWHDLFHFIGHLCGVNFKSGRVLGLEGVNTEIYEQVNSFLQCIKYTDAHLSQDHFTFFLQFFLCLMNRDKTERYQKQASIAVASFAVTLSHM